MNKPAVALLMVLIITVAAGPLSVSSAELMEYYEAYRPVTTPVEINFFSPLNNSVTNETSIPLIFNVTAPIVVSVTEKASKVDSQLDWVYCKGDWQDEKQQLYVYDYLHASNVEVFDFLEFNTTLSNVPEGTHELLIMASGTVGIVLGTMGFSYNIGSNASIIFTVNSSGSTQEPTQPSQEPFPAATVVAVSAIITVVIVAVVSILFYTRGRKNGQVTAVKNSVQYLTRK
jgi:hypothetical protein